VLQQLVEQQRFFLQPKPLKPENQLLWHFFGLQQLLQLLQQVGAGAQQLGAAGAQQTGAAAGAQHDGAALQQAAGAAQDGAGAQQLGAGAQPQPPCPRPNRPASALFMLAKHTSAAVIIAYFMTISPETA
jgi:hypothetical protein